MVGMSAPVLVRPDLLAPLSSDDEATAWRRLRALQIGQEHRWYTYLGGSRQTGYYVLRLPDGTVRHLHRNHITTYHCQETRRNESSAWLHGLACGHGNPTAFDDIEQPPPTVGTDEAARLLGIREVTLTLRVRSGTLTPFYMARRERRFLLAEINAVTDPHNPQARAEWDRVRALLPSTVRPNQLLNAEPTPPPDPLPVAESKIEAPRRLAALNIGADQGWYRYTHTSYDTYTVDVTRRHSVEIPAPSVLPWVWGFADARGAGAQAMYR